MDDSPIHVGGVNHCRVDVHHGRVVREDPAIPASADETDSSVPKSIINAAIKSNVRAPIACMENVPDAAPAPISRSPKEPDSRSHDPGARHPEISGRPVRPISG